MLVFPEEQPDALDAHYGRICSELTTLVRNAHREIDLSLQRRETSLGHAADYLAARSAFATLEQDYQAYETLHGAGAGCASHMVCRLSPHGIRPLRVDARMEVLTGYTAEEVQDDPWRIVSPAHREDVRDALNALGAAMLDGQVEHTAMVLQLGHAAGFSVWARVSATYLRQVEAHAHVLVLTFKDDSARHWVTVFLEALADAREQLSRYGGMRAVQREIDVYLRRFEADESKRAGFRKSIHGLLAQASSLLVSHVANQFFPRLRR